MADSNPQSISPKQLAKLLTAASGKPVTIEMIESDVAAGAPVRLDGTINLVEYGAWMLKELSVYGDQSQETVAG